MSLFGAAVLTFYIIVQLAASIGQLWVLIDWPVERNGIIFPNLNHHSHINHQSFLTGLFGLDYCPEA